MDDKPAILARLPIFAQLEPRSLEALSMLANVQTHRAGAVLIREGEPAESFFVIVSGTVHVERGGQLVRSMTDGGFLGEIGLLEATERTATATCTTDCQVVEFGSSRVRPGDGELPGRPRPDRGRGRSPTTFGRSLAAKRAASVPPTRSEFMTSRRHRTG